MQLGRVGRRQWRTQPRLYAACNGSLGKQNYDGPHRMQAMTSIIVPALNEESCIAETVAALQRLRGPKEIIVADGGSGDSTVERAKAAGAIVVVGCERGRGAQLHAGASVSHGSTLCFLHADTVPEPDALERIAAALQDARVAGGNFSLIFDGAAASAKQMTWIYPRLRYLGLAYGDSGIFVRREAYDAIGGFRPYPLFEDLDFIRRLRRYGR